MEKQIAIKTEEKTLSALRDQIKFVNELSDSDRWEGYIDALKFAIRLSECSLKLYNNIQP